MIITKKDFNNIKCYWLCLKKNIYNNIVNGVNKRHIEIKDCILFAEYQIESDNYILIIIPHVDEKPFYNKLMYQLSAYDLGLWNKYDDRKEKYNNHFHDFVHKDIGRYLWEEIMKTEYYICSEEDEALHDFIIENEYFICHTMFTRYNGFSKTFENELNYKTRPYYPLPTLSSFPVSIKNNNTFDNKIMESLIDEMKKDNLGLLDGISSWYYNDFNDLVKEKKE